MNIDDDMHFESRHPENLPASMHRRQDFAPFMLPIIVGLIVTLGAVIWNGGHDFVGGGLILVGLWWFWKVGPHIDEYFYGQD